MAEQSRPDMPEAYGVERTGTGMISWSWASEQMAKSRNYWIATTRPDGRPHAMPVWGVWIDETLYFGTDRKSRKARNIAANPYIVAHVESGDDVVILEGVVVEVTEMAVLTRIAEASAEKYPPYKPDPDPGPGNVMYGLRPRRALAWLESDFPRTATRWYFD
ncbi:MAG TPA: pyridoxamine 5'-phosphate oxidase family protein [Ardenticatenaceae bacterium]|jgi:general stress protein 26